jgi:monoterpene epsilon-lactone hydrolase
MKPITPRRASAFLRRRVRPRLLAAATLQEAARAFDLNLPFAPPAGGFRKARLGGVRVEVCGAGPPLLYLHGGAYFAGSPEFYRPITSFFAGQGFEVFSPAYRLAPRHPFPAALEDALAVCEALAACPFVIAGDSAGGGLALATMLARRDAGVCLPAAAALFSPWTDLAVTGASVRENERRDPVFTRRMLRIAARAYLAGVRADAPAASPLYADLHGLPPLLLQVGANELLRDDAVRSAARARDAGVAAELTIWPEVPHCWQLATGLLPEAQASLAAAAAFLRARRG